MFRMFGSGKSDSQANTEGSRRPTRHSCKPSVEVLEDRTVPTLLGKQLFPLNNAWNQKITSAPVAANSVAVMNHLASVYGDDHIRADFSQDDDDHAPLYGIPYNVVHGNTAAKVSVVIDAYQAESDVVPAPIPPGAALEGDYRDGPLFGLANRGDSHLLVYDVDNNLAYEFFGASRPDENLDGQWHAKQQTVWNMNVNQARPLGWTSADAAGLSILAGLARPDEGLPVSQGGQGIIKHAIRVTLQNDLILHKYVYPGSHVANPGNTDAGVLVPMGARFRLKASVDLTQMPPQSRILAQAMKDYGLIVADNGPNFFFSGASAAVDANNQPTLTWDNNDIQDDVVGIKSLNYSDFELVDLTPRVTGFNVNHARSGTKITVVGLNFSGAAGQLAVFFGNVRATSVTYVDDRHLTVIVPTGVTGKVHVRVQSGRTVLSAASENSKGVIFGYGISAATALDLFTIDVPLPGLGRRSR